MLLGAQGSSGWTTLVPTEAGEQLREANYRSLNV